MAENFSTLTKIEISCIVTNLFILGAFTLVLGLFLCTKPILDKASKITLAAFACCFVLRGVNWSVAIYYGHCIGYIQLGVSLLSSMIIWIMLYFFIFTMHEVKIKLDANSAKEQSKKMAILKRIKFLIIISLICMDCIFNGISSFQILKKDEVVDFDSEISILNIVSQLIRLAINTSIFIQALWLLAFFVKRKNQKMGYTYQKYTTFNKFIICSTYLLIYLNFLHQFTKSIFSILFYTELRFNQIMSNNIEIERYAIVPMIDFMSCLAFMYLFYYESNRMKESGMHLGSRIDLQRPNYNTQSLLNILNMESPKNKAAAGIFHKSSSVNDEGADKEDDQHSDLDESKANHADYNSIRVESYSIDQSTFKSFLIGQLFLTKTSPKIEKQ